jgi:outer membrane protein assembly factor BamD (BamD/ComL family)
MKIVPVLRAAICALLLIYTVGCSQNNTKAAPLSENYGAAQQALADDNFETAKTALTALAAESTGDFQKEIQTAAAAPDIDSMRLAFRSAFRYFDQEWRSAGIRRRFLPHV